MKTPEHIHDTVEALRWFVSYYPKLNGFDPRETMEYAANLIESMYEEFEQLQQKNAGLSIMLTSAQSAAETWKRKYDAAVDDLDKMGEYRQCCETCIYNNIDAKEEPCMSCCKGYLVNNWEWRGMEVE